MAEITIRKIDVTHANDARIPNQPFKIWGRMIQSLSNGKWSYEVKTLEQTKEDCFPDENYDVATSDEIFIGAYDKEKCVGLAVLRKEMFRYLYLDDLKVNRDYRRHGIGGMLIKASMQEAKEYMHTIEIQPEVGGIYDIRIRPTYQRRFEF